MLVTLPFCMVLAPVHQAQNSFKQDQNSFKRMYPVRWRGSLVVGRASTAASQCGVYNGVCLAAGL